MRWHKWQIRFLVAGAVRTKGLEVFVGEVRRKKRRKILSVTWKNYSMPAGITLLHFNFGPLHWGDVKKIRQKYKENTKEMQRKILSVTLNANWILHFKFWPLHWESRHNLAMLNFFSQFKVNLDLSFHISILYPMKREEGTPKNAQSYNKIYDRSKRSR